MTHADRTEKYVSAAVRAVTEELANTSSGRNAALNKAAHRMGQFIGAGMLGQEEAATLLVNACEANGYVRKDGTAAVRSTIKSGLNAGMKEPQPDLPASEPFTTSVRNAPKLQAANAQQTGLTLAQFAAEKKLPVDALAFFGVADGEYGGLPCVRIPYKRRDGSQARTRLRPALTGNKAHRWEGNEGEIIAYDPDGGQLARAQRYLVVNEGESDTQTLLFAGIPALGIPGADFVKVLTTEHLVDVDRVLITVELNEVGDPDSGAERFVPNVRARLEALGFKGSVHELRMPEKAKDPSALWVRGPAAFPALVLAAIETASKPKRRSKSVADLIEVIESDGQFFGTGFPSLDSSFDNKGLPTSSLTVLLGGPGSRKTGLGTHLADTLSRAGCAALFMACDESRQSIVVRLGQRAGYSREGLQTRGTVGASIRAGFKRAEEESGRILRLIEIDDDDDAQTIEDAHAELVALAGDRVRVLIVDSLQTVRCAASEALPADTQNLRARIDAKVRTFKRLKKTGTIIVVISEVSRAFYNGSAKRIEKENVLSAAKESGGVEFGVDLLIGLVRSKSDENAVEMVVAKSRIGLEPRFWVQWDRERAELSETEAPFDAGAPDGGTRERDRAVRDTELHRKIRDALLKSPGLSKNAIRAVLKLQRSSVYDAVAEMAADGLLIEEPRHSYCVNPAFGARDEEQ
jgi:KaiC/GvpD/RAD55 family RecA-like ATPase